MKEVAGKQEFKTDGEEKCLGGQKDGMKLITMGGKSNLAYWAWGENSQETHSKMMLNFLHQCKKQFEDHIIGSKQIPDLTAHDCKGFQQTLQKLVANPQPASEQALIQKINGVKMAALDALDQSMVRLKLAEANEELATQLQDSAKKMKDKTNQVKKKYCWENAKCWIFITVIALLAIGVLVLIICLSTGCD